MFLNAEHLFIYRALVVHKLVYSNLNVLIYFIFFDTALKVLYVGFWLY